MRSPAAYDVLAKWDTPSFDDVTREALRARLSASGAPRFFDDREMRLLDAVTARLIPQPDRARPIPVARLIDDYLAEDRGGGFWIEGMPRLAEAWKIGLTALEAEAQQRFSAAFIDLAAADQEAILSDVQAGHVDPSRWRPLDPAAFFKNTLLKLTAGLYYAHPAAWSEIGFGGPASPRGYVRLGLDERDPWEAPEARR